ncbi:Fic family protein [Amycolatopsis sp., V23-08]|uniref:Fic family protein n=1 Tax=Amycolatopsis heterodermiae TaxID=3110235 RepID=A0ABU5R6W6_9PSEU|nr:Fic family protein [Amycolatopsis sp., V23-08]MEA5361966.1 Fic family protein [Amycolatopsis sp., V23-08]
MAEPIRYLNLNYFVSAAAVALNVPEGTAALMVNVGLAESALAAPAAGFGDYEQYPRFADKVAILLQRVASNHSLPDGNKRTALLCAIAFAALNGWDWVPPEGDLDDGKETDEVVRAAAAGTVPFPALSAWVTLRLKRVK